MFETWRVRDRCSSSGTFSGSGLTDASGTFRIPVEINNTYDLQFTPPQGTLLDFPSVTGVYVTPDTRLYPNVVASASGSEAPGPTGLMSVVAYDHVTRTASLAWDPACGATDYAAYIGILGSFGSYDEANCSVGIDGIVLPDHDAYWVVVGTTGANGSPTQEGSYGTTSFGRERTPSSGLCGHCQDLRNTCD